MTLYMTNSEVDAYNDAQYGLETEAQDGYLYRSDADASGIGCRCGKKTVRVIDEVYLCEEVSRNRVTGFRSLSDASLERILETNGMETLTRGSTRWTIHLWVRRTRTIGRYLRIQENLQEAEGILLRRNEHMDVATTWANEHCHDLEMGTLFEFDENWANRAWTDLELFGTMESNDIASNNLQTVRNPASQREKLSDYVVSLAMPESEWDRHGIQTMGPQRWRNHVQDIDLHDHISSLESKVQVPLTTAYEDVAADDEYSDSDVEDQHVDYQEYHSPVRSITATNGQLWCPFCTAIRLRHRTIWEQLYDEEGNPRITFLASVQSHRERLFEILRCFKIQTKPGLLPVLVDSGSTCVITPYLRQIILCIPNKTIISGVGTGSVSFASPIIFTAVATTGAYEMFTFPTGYFMLDLNFAIMPCAYLERAGYEFTLSASYSRTKSSEGVVVPFVCDAQTGFHFLIDHLSKKKIHDSWGRCLRAGFRTPVEQKRDRWAD